MNMNLADHLFKADDFRHLYKDWICSNCNGVNTLHLFSTGLRCGPCGTKVAFFTENPHYMYLLKFLTWFILRDDLKEEEEKKKEAPPDQILVPNKNPGQRIYKAFPADSWLWLPNKLNLNFINNDEEVQDAKKILEQKSVSQTPTLLPPPAQKKKKKSKQRRQKGKKIPPKDTRWTCSKCQMADNYVTDDACHSCGAPFELVCQPQRVLHKVEVVPTTTTPPPAPLPTTKPLKKKFHPSREVISKTKALLQQQEQERNPVNKMHLSRNPNHDAITQKTLFDKKNHVVVRWKCIGCLKSNTGTASETCGYCGKKTLHATRQRGEVKLELKNKNVA